jgi:cadmium resistance protein CadD (predicted permease)
MGVGLIGQATGLFAATNIDDIVVLALFFGQAKGRAAALQVVLGWYAGYVVVLAGVVAVGVVGARLLPESVIPLLGLLPLVLGLRAAWRTWRTWRAGRVGGPTSGDEDFAWTAAGPGVGTTAAVSLANGGDNIGVYVPVFTASRPGEQLVYVVVFLVLIAVWCAAGRLVASRPVVARAMTRWGHIVLPVVLIGLGLSILIEGHVSG